MPVLESFCGQEVVVNAQLIFQMLFHDLEISSRYSAEPKKFENPSFSMNFDLDLLELWPPLSMSLDDVIKGVHNEPKKASGLSPWKRSPLKRPAKVPRSKGSKLSSITLCKRKNITTGIRFPKYKIALEFRTLGRFKEDPGECASDGWVCKRFPGTPWSYSTFAFYDDRLPPL